MRATLEMRPRIQALNASSPLLAADPIQIRMGISSGDVILCDLGAADARMDLTIIGDTVNLAARLESACKQYGIDLLVAESTYEPVRALFEARPIDLVQVKGKTKPIACYEVFAERGRATAREDQLIAQYSEAVATYRTGDFGTALGLFEATDAMEAVTAPGCINPSRLYQDRCRHLLAHPPEHWDGVWVLSSK